jgi:hypothetical protein
MYGVLRTATLKPLVAVAPDDEESNRVPCDVVGVFAASAVLAPRGDGLGANMDPDTVIGETANEMRAIDTLAN